MILQVAQRHIIERSGVKEFDRSSRQFSFISYDDDIDF